MLKLSLKVLHTHTPYPTPGCSLCDWPDSALWGFFFKWGSAVTKNLVMSVVYCFCLQEMYTKSYLPEKRKNQRTWGRSSAYSLFFWLYLGDIELLFLLLSVGFFLFACWVLMALSFQTILKLCILIKTAVFPIGTEQCRTVAVRGKSPQLLLSLELRGRKGPMTLLRTEASLSSRLWVSWYQLKS